MTDFGGMLCNGEWACGQKAMNVNLQHCLVVTCLQVVHKRKSEVRNRTAMKAKRSLFSILNQELEVYTRGTDHQRFSNGAANAYGDRR